MAPQHNIPLNGSHQQRGAVLIVSLIMLLVMTLLGVSSMKGSAMEEKMTRNLHDKNLAFQAAEAALRAAEQNIQDNIIATNIFDTDGSDGLYDRSDLRIWENIDWTANDSLEYSGFDSTYRVDKPPRYVIQHLATTVDATDALNQNNYGQGTGAGKIETFLITARGTGGSDDTVVILQSSWGKRL
ncbi:MAG TPA: pilus assembly protein PilX [Gammaproteobacteria bacterium]|nr:pilus assembly protein PilX [Gammaproteobacteria bacterium]